MKLKSKEIIKIMSLLLLLCGITLTTIAYYTDAQSITTEFNKEKEENTSQGAIKILLEEPSWDALKTKLATQENTLPENTTKNELFLKPGAVYPKDPTVTIMKDNTDAYIFMALDHSLFSKSKSLVNFHFSSDWTDITNDFVTPELKVKSPNKKLYLYTGTKGIKIEELKAQRYIKTNSENIELAPLFTKVSAISDFDSSDLSLIPSLTITVEAYAHQATTEDYTGTGIKTVDLFTTMALPAALEHFYK